MKKIALYATHSKVLLILFLFLSLYLKVFAKINFYEEYLSPSRLEWDDTCYATFQKTYGGSGKDLSYQITETLDGNYIQVGYTSSAGNGGYDGFLQKINRDGSVAWCTVLGGTGNDILYHVCPTTDSGFVATGQTLSFGGGSNGVAWIVKADKDGNLIWSKKYDDGNTHGSAIYNIVQTIDGGYAACGENTYDPSF